MSRGPNIRRVRHYQTELPHESSPAHEANRIVKMVRTGLLNVDQARVLIGVSPGEAITLRKLLTGHAADAVLLFRRNVLRLFNALTQPAKARRTVSATRRR